jgi:predicted RNA-binding protein with TRAM domain
MLKLQETLTLALILKKRRESSISPRKRSPRNAKSKRGRGNCPVTVGNEYEVEVSQMSPNGEGIASVRGFPVFIGNVRVGDHVKVRITGLDSVSADAEVTSRI